MHKEAVPSFRGWIRLGALAVLFSPLTLWAEDSILLKGNQGVAVTTQDVRNELQIMPGEVQAKILANTAQLKQLIDNIYLRRVAAIDAEKKALDKQANTLAKLRLMRENVLGEAWIAHVDSTVQPTEKDLDAYALSTYKAEPKRFEEPVQYHARHILLMGATNENKAKAEKLLAELKTGANFEELARQHSGDPGSSSKGGDLGWFPKGRMVKEFDDTLDTLKNSGDLSEVVQTRFGYHIIKLEGRKPAKMREFSEVREQLHSEAKNKLLKEAREQAIIKLRGQPQGDADAFQAFVETEKAKRGQ